MVNLENTIPLMLQQQRRLVAQAAGRTSLTTIKRPSWSDMIKNYPGPSVDAETLYKKIGNGLIDLLHENPNSWENTCAFRMSRGLNYSGLKLPSDNSKYRARGSKGGIHKGDDKLNYWYRVGELGKWLDTNLGSPEFEKNLPKARIGEKKVGLSDAEWTKLKALKGIVMFKVSGWGNASGHFTLWNGRNLIYPGMAEHDDPNSEYYYFKMKYEDTGRVIQTDTIKLWELK